MPLFKYDNHDKRPILNCTERVICIYCFVLPRIFRVLSKTNIHFMLVNNPSSCCRLRTDPGWIYHIYIWYLILAYAKASIHYANRALKAKTHRSCDIKNRAVDKIATPNLVDSILGTWFHFQSAGIYFGANYGYRLKMGIHWWPAESLTNGQKLGKGFHFDDVIT